MSSTGTRTRWKSCDAMTRDEARAYFKDKGLAYNDVLLADLYHLQKLIDRNFIREQLARILDGPPAYWKAVNPAKRFKGKFTPASDEKYGHLICAFLTGRGEYFTRREVISFNANGFIGFCGAASDANAQPVLEAFVEWCDWLTWNGATASVPAGQESKGE